MNLDTSLSLIKRSLGDFTYTQPPFPLSIWTGIFGKVRKMAVMGASIPIQAIMQGSYVSGGMYFLPMGIIVAVLLVGLLLMIFACCCMCCCQCCGNFRAKYAKRKPAGVGKKVYASVLFILPVIIIGLCAAFHILGSMYLSTSIKVIETGVMNTMTDTGSLLNNVPNVVTNLVANLKTDVSFAIDMVTDAVNMQVLEQLVFPAMLSMINLLYLCATDQQLLMGNSTIVAYDTDLLKNDTTALLAATTAILAAVNLLNTNQSVTGYPGYTWTVRQAISTNGVDATQINNEAQSAPDTNSIFASLNSAPNLATYADEANTTLYDAKTSAYTMIANTKATFKNSSVTSLNSVQTMVNQAFTPIQSQVLTQLSSFESQATSMFTMVNGYDVYRGYGQLGLVALYGLPILFIYIFGAFRKPGLMKCCNLLCVPYYALLSIFAIIFVLLTFVLGDGNEKLILVCDLAFDYPGDTSPLAAIQATIGVGLTAVSQCYQNQSLFTVIGNTGLVDKDQLNFTKQASTVINSFNFSQVSSFDIDGVINLSQDPTSQISSISNLNVNALNTSALDSIHNVLVAPLNNSLTSLSNSIIQLMPLGQNGITVYGTNPNSTVIAQATANFVGQLQSIVNQINDITNNTNGVLTQVDGNSALLSLAIANLKTSATVLIADALSIPTYYNYSIANITDFAHAVKTNISNEIPLVVDYILSAVGDQQQYLSNSFPCNVIAADVYQIRQGLCGGIVPSFDAFWSSLTIMSLWSFLSLPIIVFVANNLFLDLTPYQNKDKQYEDEGKGGKGKGEKEKGGAALPPTIYAQDTREYASPLSEAPVSPISRKPTEDMPTMERDVKKAADDSPFMAELLKKAPNHEDADQLDAEEALIPIADIDQDLPQYDFNFPATNRVSPGLNRSNIANVDQKVPNVESFIEINDHRDADLHESIVVPRPQESEEEEEEEAIDIPEEKPGVTDLSEIVQD
ncbi:hypothetical protein HDV01_001211 [Terramyces sp. JEL0728]|nr:hypothetical protein HDV01_001211 [Terramyces sp. JEL0728]